MKILITGGMGFIGSNLIKELHKKHDLIVLDNERFGINQLLQNNNYTFQYVKGDICDEKIVKELTKNIDIVIHLAAEISVYESIEKVKYYNEKNVLGTINLLKYSVKNNVKRFIFASSCSVYGSPKRDTKIKESSKLIPENPYSITKKHCEDYCNYYSTHSKMKMTILRFSNVYGINQVLNRPYSGCIINFVENIKQNKQCVIYGDGHQKRDFVHVFDIVSSINFVIKKNINGTFNISSGALISIGDLLSSVYIVSGKEFIPPIYNESRNGDFFILNPSNEKILKHGFTFKYTDILDGLKTMFL